MWGCAVWDQGWFTNSSEGATFPGTSLSTISLEFSSLALSFLWLESSCPAVYFPGLRSLPRPSGWTDRERKQKGFPHPLWMEAPPVPAGGFLPKNFGAFWFLLPVSLLLSQGCLDLRQGWKKQQKEKIGNFPLSWASTVFFLVPWPEGFSWRVLHPALRTTHGFQVSRSSGLGTERGCGKVRLFQQYCESWSSSSVFLLLFALQSPQIVDACILCRCDSLHLTVGSDLGI